MKTYKVLCQQKYSTSEYSIVPIRFEDRYDIMKWRNEQMYHLRQDKPLTKTTQDNYFKIVVSKLFDEEKPSQVLFSYLKGEQLIGYGGLVHINWIDKNAEISFVMNTQLEKNNFELNWTTFLKLIEKVAFFELNFHKIYTFAFNLRPALYVALEKVGFNKEAVLKEHCLFDKQFIDVIIHEKRNSLILRPAESKDVKLIFKWANDKDVRQNAINTNSIIWDEHIDWFNKKLSSNNTQMFILQNKNEQIGQIRIEKNDNYWTIDYSIDKKYRGQGFGKIILKKLLNTSSNRKFKAQVKKENIASKKTFISLGFKQLNDNKSDLIDYVYE